MKHVTASSLSELLPKEAGDHLTRENQDTAAQQVLGILKSNLDNYSFSEVEETFYKATRNLKLPIPFTGLFCQILSLLPGKWTKLTNDPGISSSTMFLLTDGSVLCQQANDKLWKRLRPDSFGSYLNGTWSDVSPSNDKRLYYSSAVLSDGRLIVCGGEYAGGNA